jgi:hypothetical protein
MKKNKLILLFIMGIMILATTFLVVYFSNSLAFFNLCKPGEKIRENSRGDHFCYTPSGFAGLPCDKKTDCGTGSCSLEDPTKTTGKGTCRDSNLGCYIWIDENGEFDESNEVCLD